MEKLDISPLTLVDHWMTEKSRYSNYRYFKNKRPKKHQAKLLSQISYYGKKRNILRFSFKDGPKTERIIQEYK